MIEIIDNLSPSLELESLDMDRIVLRENVEMCASYGIYTIGEYKKWDSIAGRVDFNHLTSN